MRTFASMQVTIMTDELTMIETEAIKMPEAIPLILAPAVVAGLLRELAGRLEDLDKAGRLGLSSDIALSLAGLQEQDLNGEGS